VRSRAWQLKAAALVFAGSLAVHELRYLVSYGTGAGAAEARQGHGYLEMVAPVVATAAVVALATWLIRLAAARPGIGGEPPIPTFARLWACAAAALSALYVAQESLEGMLSAGHPPGLAGVLGHGGWMALVLAIVVGAVLAAFLRAAGAGLAPPGRADTRPPVLAPVAAAVAVPAGAPLRRDPVARFLAGRGPPPTSA
jgi:hypothetical protein